MRISVDPCGDEGRSDKDASGEAGKLELISLVPFQNGFSARKSSFDGKNHTTMSNMITRAIESIIRNLRSSTT